MFHFPSETQLISVQKLPGHPLNSLGRALRSRNASKNNSGRLGASWRRSWEVLIHLGDVLERLGTHSERLGAALGASSGVLGCLGCFLERLGAIWGGRRSVLGVLARLGAPWRVLERLGNVWRPSWVRLGVVLARLGRLWERLRGILARLGAVFGASWSRLGLDNFRRRK